MKKWMLTICCVLLLGVVGCEDELRPEQVQELAVQVQGLNTAMDSYQSATEEVLETLQTHQIIDETVVEKVEKASSEIDRVQPQVADIVAAIMAVNLGDNDIDNWIALLQAANQGSAPWNPYALPISAGLTLATLIYGLWKRREAQTNKEEAKQSQAKYQAQKQGTELTARQNPEIQAKLYENIGNARVANHVV